MLHSHLPRLYLVRIVFLCVRIYQRREVSESRNVGNVLRDDASCGTHLHRQDQEEGIRQIPNTRPILVVQQNGALCRVSTQLADSTICIFYTSGGVLWNIGKGKCPLARQANRWTRQAQDRGWQTRQQQ